MNQIYKLSLLLTLSATAIFAGCKSHNSKHHSGAVAVAVLTPAKAAATQPSNTHVTGAVTFTEVHDGVIVHAHVDGLSPGEHGFHIHEKADLSDPTLAGAGAHYNPGMTKHGGLESEMRHAGDLGNITADTKGDAHLEVTLKHVKLSDLVGRSVIVHAKPDDLKTDPSGNSGGRVAGGVIEMKK